eukprot:Skav224395  [mRNA]  locus=scaffold2452:105652:115235:- [translate_table: standard]
MVPTSMAAVYHRVAVAFSGSKRMNFLPGNAQACVSQGSAAAVVAPGMAETIAFVAVILATCYEKSVLNEEKKSFETALATVLDRAKSAYPGWRDRAMCPESESILYTFADSQALCLLAVGIRDAQYPERVALQLLRDVADKVKNSQGDEGLLEAKSGSLSKPLRKLLTDIMRRAERTYNDAGAHDKTTEAIPNSWIPAPGQREGGSVERHYAGRPKPPPATVGLKFSDDLWAKKEGMVLEDIYLWVCFFCNNQYRILESGAQMRSDELKDVFESQLAAAGKMLVLLDSFVDPIYIRRAWCIFESFVCIDKKFPMTFILPERAEGTFIEILDESGSFSKLKKAFDSLDVRYAEASSNSDVVSS